MGLVRRALAVATGSGLSVVDTGITFAWLEGQPEITLGESVVAAVEDGTVNSVDVGVVIESLSPFLSHAIERQHHVSFDVFLPRAVPGHLFSAEEPEIHTRPAPFVANLIISPDGTLQLRGTAEGDTGPAAPAVLSNDLSIVERLDRSDPRTTGVLTTALEPLYNLLQKAIQDGSFAHDEELERQAQRDAESLRRELWETRMVRPRLVYDFALEATRLLADLEDDHVATAIIESIVPNIDGPPLDGSQAVALRDEFATAVPDEHVPDGLHPEHVVDAALGWRDYLDVGAVGTSVSIAGIVTWYVQAAGGNPVVTAVATAFAGIIAATFIVKHRRHKNANGE